MIIFFKHKKIKYFNIVVISLVLLFFDFMDHFQKRSLDEKYLKIKEFEDSYEKTFFDYFFFDDQLSQIKKYREINSKDLLISNSNFEKNEDPEISVIITVYNQANQFYAALRSVQNQSLKNIEIIIIDDCSLDNTTKMIKKYMAEDKRIIYLKHDNNDGKIKSRSDGIRIAKGKYITIIDGDDALSNSNILNNSLIIAKIANLDIVQFRDVFFRKKFFQKLNYCNLESIKNLKNRIIYQPELTFKFVDFGEKESIEGFRNRNIVAKLVKNEIFKSVLEYIGPKYTEDYLLDYEDTIMSISLFKIANSYYYMKERGYYISKEEFEKPFPFIENKKCNNKNLKISKELDPIKFLNFLLDKSEGSEIESKLIYKELITINYHKKLSNPIKTNFSYVYSILDRIYNYNFITKIMKKRIYKIREKLLKSIGQRL